MADETIIFDFKIEQGDALTTLEQTKKSILELKQEQQSLNSEYKKGRKSIEDYTKETVQLEAALKKQSAQYTEVQRKVTGIQNPFDKLNNSIKDQAKSVTVAGVSLQSFLNPATAVTAAIGGLTAVYANSTAGAKDLEFAQNALSIATKQLSNDFIALFGISAEDGQGFFSKQLTGMFKNLSLFSKKAFGTSGDLGNTIEKQALIIEKIQDLEREETKILGDNADRKSQISDLQTKLNAEGVTYNEKLRISNQILELAKKNQTEILKIKQEELFYIKEQLKVNKDDENLQAKVNQAERELSQAKKQAARDIKQAEISKGNIVEINNKLLKQEKEIAATMEAQANAARLERELMGPGEKDIFDKEDLIKTKKIANAEEVFQITSNLLSKQAKEGAEANEKFQKEEKEKTRIAKIENANRLATVSSYLGQAQSLFAEDSIAYKTMGVGRATIDTYRAADLALATYPPPFGAVAAGVAIATGLANVAKILDVGFASGGYTGDGGKYDVAGTVHRGEVVWSQADVALAGGAKRVNAMRPTYSDGGLVSDYMGRQSSSGMQSQSIQVALVYEEFKRFTQSVTYKEQATTV